MEIKSISKKIFRTSPNKVESNSSHTNPFGVNFKGNMISADVFETTAKSDAALNLVEKVSNRSKMVISAIVGSINSVNQNISSRFNSIVSLGKRIKEKASNAYRYLNETNLVVNIGLSKNNTNDLFKLDFWSQGAYSINNLKKKTTSELGEMLEETIAARV